MKSDVTEFSKTNKVIDHNVESYLQDLDQIMKPDMTYNFAKNNKAIDKNLESLPNLD